jgi:hypothetical protein
MVSLKPATHASSRSSVAQYPAPYPNKRLGHLRYAAGMLAPVLVEFSAPLIGHCLALGLWIAVKLSALLLRR